MQRHTLAVSIFLFALTAEAFKFVPKLYEIKLKGTNQVAGYVFGTNHVLVDAEELPQTFWKYFDSAEAYAVESTPTADDSQFEQYISIHKYRDPKSQSLDEALTKKEIKNLRLFYNDYSDKDFNKNLMYYSPFYYLEEASRKLRTFYAKYKLRTLKKVFRSSLDRQLQEKIKDNKPVTSLDLDTKEFFDCIYLTDEKESLKNLKILLSHNRIPEAKVGKGGWPYADNENCIVTGRNKLWMPSILSLLKTKTTFIAVGGAHVDEDAPSLVTLLKEAGYDVNLVKL